MKAKKSTFPVVLANLVPGMAADIRALEQISLREPCEIIVLKRSCIYSTYDKDSEYETVEHERPFIRSLRSSPEIQREMNFYLTKH